MRTTARGGRIAMRPYRETGAHAEPTMGQRSTRAYAMVFRRGPSIKSAFAVRDTVCPTARGGRFTKRPYRNTVAYAESPTGQRLTQTYSSVVSRR